jgi:hypothetical protein
VGNGGQGLEGQSFEHGRKGSPREPKAVVCLIHGESEDSSKQLEETGEEEVFHTNLGRICRLHPIVMRTQQGFACKIGKRAL